MKVFNSLTAKISYCRNNNYKSSSKQTNSVYQPVKSHKANKISFKGINKTQEIAQNIGETINKFTKGENPLVLSFKDKSLEHVAKHIESQSTRPFVIGVAGKSASGKSFFTRTIFEAISNIIPGKLVSFSMDNYYKDISGIVESAGGKAKFLKDTEYSFDEPNAIDLDLFKRNIISLRQGKKVTPPLYDKKTGKRSYNITRVRYPRPIVINDGLFALNKNLLDIQDFKIYVDAPQNVIKERWFKREATRFPLKTKKKIINTKYQDTIEKAKIHVLPTKNSADIVINGNSNKNAFILFTNTLINTIADLYNK